MSDATNPKDLIGIKKPDLALIPGSALIHLAKAFENGRDKYGSFNWRDKKVQAMIYASADIRHGLSWIDGEDYAQDSGVHHLAHKMACCAILLDAIECGCLIDNRPTKGASAALIQRLTK